MINYGCNLKTIHGMSKLSKIWTWHLKYTISESRGSLSDFRLLSNIEKQIIFKHYVCSTHFFQNVIENHEIRKRTFDCSSNLSHGTLWCCELIFFEVLIFKTCYNKLLGTDRFLEAFWACRAYAWASL